MAEYQLAFEDLEVARIRLAGDPVSAPLAWFRVVWVAGSNQVDRVHIYRHAERVGDRPWLATVASIPAAVAYCDRLEHDDVAGEYDWSEGSIETSL